MPTADQVADKARWYSENDYRFPSGFCLGFSRRCAGADGGVHDAADAWRAARYRHSSGTPPRGSLIYWLGGSQGFGHISVSEGSGRTWSTDIGYYNGARRSLGYVDLVSIAYINAKWPNLQYVGWAEDVNGVHVTGLTGGGKVTVRLRNLYQAASGQDPHDVQLALRRHGYGRLNPSGATGYWGLESIAMCAAFQKAQGWSGHDADGIPGQLTCERLGLEVIQ